MKPLGHHQARATANAIFGLGIYLGGAMASLVAFVDEQDETMGKNHGETSFSMGKSIGETIFFHGKTIGKPCFSMGKPRGNPFCSMGKA